MTITHIPITSVPPGAKVLYLNATLLKNTYCTQNLDFLLNENLSAKLASEIPTLGTAIHKFCEVVDTSGDKIAALDAAREVLQRERLAAAMMPKLIAVAQVRRRYEPPVMLTDGKPALELEFRIPWRKYAISWVTENEKWGNLEGVDTLHTAEVYVVLWGKIDRLDIHTFAARLLDTKTTHYRDVSKALKLYQHEVQFSFYMWVLSKYCHQLNIPAEVCALIDENHMFAQANIASFSAAPDWKLSEPIYWSSGQYNRINRLIETVLESKLLPLFAGVTSPTLDGWASNQCVDCQFAPVCHAQDSETAARIKENLFEQHTYGTYKE